MSRKTRIEELGDALAQCEPPLIVRTYSPGDGVTRYRFFEASGERQSYFGPANGIYTALGWKEAVTYARGAGARI